MCTTKRAAIKIAATVLYLDLERVTLEPTTALFRKIFSQLLVASNDEEAFSLYKAHKPDIIIVDVSKPLNSTMTLLERVRELDKTLPIILLTSLQLERAKKEFDRFHINAYIAQPLYMDAFERIVISLLA